VSKTSKHNKQRRKKKERTINNEKQKTTPSLNIGGGGSNEEKTGKQTNLTNGNKRGPSSKLKKTKREIISKREASKNST